MDVDISLRQITALKEQWKSNKGDRADAKRLHRMACGEWADDIPHMPAEPERHARDRPKFAPNILGQALRALNTLYSEEPHRTIEDEGAQEWAGKKLWGFGLGLSVAMERADVLTNLLGTSILYPAYKPGPDAARGLREALLAGGGDVAAGEDDGVEVLCLPRYHFELLANEFDPRHVEAVVIHMGHTKKKVQGNSNTVAVHHYWDRDHVAVLHNFEPQPLNEDGDTIVPHGLTDHPIVACRNDESTLATYSAGWGGKDLRANLLAIGSQLREYGWTAKLQRGQPYTVGVNKNMVLAPDAFWQIELGGTAGILSNNANLQGMLDSAMAHLSMWAQGQGLPSRTFALQEQRAGMSGVAIALDRAEITDHRNRRQKLTRAWERAITRKSAALYGAVRSAAPHAIVMDVVYRPLPTIVTFEEKTQRLEFLAERGWLAPTDAMRELYPDISDAEIDARLERAEEYHAAQREHARSAAEEDANRQVSVATASRPADPFAAFGI